ncbi:MAG: hypothetical protein ACI4VW_05510 [Acutalibacteraceae bacterium]
MKSEQKKSKIIGKVVLAILIAIVVGGGIYGTVIGIKGEVEDRKTQATETDETTEEFKLSQGKKTFSCDGFSITVTDDFENFEDSAIDLGCVNDGLEIYVLKDSFEESSDYSRMTPEEYIRDIIGENNTVQVKEYNGVPYAEYYYRGEDNNILKKYRVFCYKGDGCFWMLHFIAESSYSSKYKPYIFEWVDTVTAE